MDTRLVWDKSSKTSQDYSDIKFLFATEEYVWRPSIIIENSVDGISVISDKSVPMRIAKDGRVIWNPAGVYKVSCESDTKYYPMDTQECYLKVSAWAYTKAEIELFFKVQNVDTSFYTENGEWNLLSAESFKSEAKTRDGDAFSSVSFLVKLQRRLLFHVVNTLFPVALMAILIAFVFKLPVDSGEKIGFSLTVLLSYAVYLTLISDNIPSTSVTVCLLSMYLAFILFLATIAVCLTTFVINLHMRTDDERIPDWVKKFTSTYLIKFACWKQNCACKRNKVKDNGSDVNVTRTDDIPLTDKANHPDIETESEEESRNLTWKELSEIMDKDWLDTRLSWDDTNKMSQDYTNIIFLFSSEEYIWRPAIIIENAVDKISVISDKSVPMRIAPDGRVIWNPAGVYKISCESDTRYYPMDTQECYLKVSS
ncbi:unnamed protein product [Mytilus coruscus]|uniref:CHRNN n=1 Tax=Mytilus coruscus TaxID=42192 RepID=A0A6J8D3X4_MYTCO|nr:unnamed protein product [Mytilus coruscus]